MSYITSRILISLKLIYRNIIWRKNNKDNGTWLERDTNTAAISIGARTYGPLKIYNDTDSRLEIGSFCSIADDVTFLLGIEHELKKFSTFPFKTMILDTILEAHSKGNIIVGNDVWIGYGATILSGIHIGQGAVIAAKSVVTKDVPPYAIVGGTPAKVIKYRFEPELIEELLKVDYNNLTKEEIEKHIDELYLELKDKRQLEWMPKKPL